MIAGRVRYDETTPLQFFVSLFELGLLISFLVFFPNWLTVRVEFQYLFSQLTRDDKGQTYGTFYKDVRRYRFLLETLRLWSIATFCSSHVLIWSAVFVMVPGWSSNFVAFSKVSETRFSGMREKGTFSWQQKHCFKSLLWSVSLNWQTFNKSVLCGSISSSSSKYIIV